MSIVSTWRVLTDNGVIDQGHPVLHRRSAIQCAGDKTNVLVLRSDRAIDPPWIGPSREGSCQQRAQLRRQYFKVNQGESSITFSTSSHPAHGPVGSQVLGQTTVFQEHAPETSASK